MKPSAPVMNTRRGASATPEPALVVSPRGRIHAGVQLVEPEGAPERVAPAWGKRRLEAEDAPQPARHEDLVPGPLDRGGHGLADLLGVDPAPAARGLGPDGELGAHEVRVDRGQLDPIAPELLAHRVGEALHRVLAGRVGG